MFVVDIVAEALPDEHLDSLLIHEFAHFLLIAESDEHHCTNTGPDRLLRCEKRVWDLTATWGVDTTEAELWMKRHFIDNKDELRCLGALDFDRDGQIAWSDLQLSVLVATQSQEALGFSSTELVSCEELLECAI